MRKVTATTGDRLPTTSSVTSAPGKPRLPPECSSREPTTVADFAQYESAAAVLLDGAIRPEPGSFVEPARPLVTVQHPQRDLRVARCRQPGQRGCHQRPAEALAPHGGRQVNRHDLAD